MATHAKPAGGATRAPKKKAKRLAPATAPFKPGTDEFKRRHEEAKAKRTQGPRVPGGPQPGQVASRFGLTDPGNPFGPQGGASKAGAQRNTPQLTQKAALAKARRERLQQGGLTTPKTAAAEKAAERVVPTRIPRMTLPPGVVDTPAPPRRQPHAAPPHERPLGSVQRGDPSVHPGGGFDIGGALEVLRSGLSAAGSAPGVRPALGVAKTVLDPVRLLPEGRVKDYLDYANTTQHVLFPNPEETVLRMTGIRDRESAGAQRTMQGLTNLAGKLRQGPGKIPHVAIPLSALNPEGEAYAAAKRSGAQSVPLDEVLRRYGEGSLGTQYRKQLIDQAHERQGWNISDAGTWSDADAAARAFNPYDHSVMGFFRNAASDVAVLGAGANIAPLLGGPLASAARGDFQPAARTAAEFADQWRRHLLFVGDRPIWENLYQTPFTTATSNAPILRGVGVRAGKLGGLKPTREVELPLSVDPETGAPITRTRQVPSTQNVFTRPGTKITDALLRHAEPPEARLQAARPTTMRGELAATAGRPLAAAGNRIVRRHVRGAERLQTNQAILRKGSEARRANDKLLAAIRNLPAHLGDVVRSRKVELGETGETIRISDKQRRAEALIKASAVGARNSDELVRYYEGEARHTLEAQIPRERAAAEHERELERALRDGGESEEAGKHASAAADHESEVRRLELVAENQQRQAEHARQNPIDLENLSEPEQRVVDAARSLSRVTTDIKRAQTELGERGAQYGDLQHAIEIVARIDADSPLGRLANDILGHRETIQTLEKNAGKLGDRKSPKAQQALGEVRTHQRLLRDVQGRIEAVNRRRQRAHETLTRQAGGEVEGAGARRGVPEEIQGQAEAAAQRAGVAPGVLQRIRQEGARELTRRRETRQAVVDKARAVADEAERGELSEHDAVAGGRVRAAERALRQARYRATGGATERIRSQAEEEIPRLETNARTMRSLHENFQPSARLTKLRERVSRLEAKVASTELSEGEVSAISRRHISDAQERAIGKVVLHHAVNEAEHAGATRELERLQARHSEAVEQAEGRYRALAGSSVEAADRIARAQEAFDAGLDLFQQEAPKVGRDPYHIKLHRPGDKVGRSRVTTTENKLFPEGNYTNDIHIQIAAELEGWARTAVENEAFSEMARGPFVINDPPPNSRIPPGFTLTDAELLKTPRKPIFGTEGNEIHPDLAGAWAKEAREPSKIVPDDGRRYALVSDYTKEYIGDTLGRQSVLAENKLMSGILNFTNAYRRWMLFTLPRTLVNNAVGNAFLALVGGAGIMDYLRAIHVLRNHPDQIPILQRHLGPVHNALESKKITGYQATLRDANVFQEDLGRLSVYMHHVIRYARHEQGLKFYQRIDMASEQMTNLLKDLASGKDPNVHKFMDFANEFFGDMSKRGKWDPVLSTAILFHRWVGHMIRLTLWTMPTKYPGRAALLLNLSRMADEYRKEHGIFPDWAKGMVELTRTNDIAGGLVQPVSWGLSTGGLMPFATPGQTLDFGSDANPKLPFASIAAANINPLARIGLEQGFGRRLDTLEDFKDQYGNPTGPLNWHVLLNQIIGNTPVLSTAAPRTGLADTSLQLDPRAPRRFNATAARDPSYYPPLARDRGWVLDALSRLGAAAGLTVRGTDVSPGERTRVSAGKTVAFQQRQAADRQRRKALADYAKLYEENAKRWRTGKP